MRRDGDHARKSLLLQVSRQPSEKKMHEMVHRISQGGLTRDQARLARKEETETAPRPQPFVFDYKAADESFQLRLQFRRSHISTEELAATLRAVLREIEVRLNISSSAAPTASHVLCCWRLRIAIFPHAYPALNGLIVI